MVAAAYAVPAKTGLRTVTQPDGSTVTVRVEGDEHYHYYTTENGILLTVDENGFFIEATEKEKQKHKIRSQAPQSNLGLTSTTYPRLGSPKGLIIMVEYSDVKFYNPDAPNYFNEMINGEEFTLYGGTGSVLQYFADQSGGKFIPSFDILGPVTLPQTQRYYGGNNGGGDSNPSQMVIDAVELLDPDVDFSIYDTDGDGIIDNVYLFYAGQGEADYGSPDTVWPHSWDLRLGNKEITVDGVVLAKYACSNEWQQNSPCGIGTFVHEFSHVLGLPDLYNTIYGSSDYTPGAYSVLDRGPYNNQGRTPPNYTAFERNALGWDEPLILDVPMSVAFDDIACGAFGLIPSSDTNEFFLLENRQKKGWDAYIPHHGLLIWHIDYDPAVFQGNAVNNDRNHPCVDIVKANNNVATPAGYTYPGLSGKTSFTASTYPSLRTWDREDIDLPITDITEKGGIIYFDVAGGGFKLNAPSPKVTEWSENNGYFVVSWDKVENATDYLLTVYTNDGSRLGSSTTGFDNSQLPDGWNASATSWNTTPDTYGESAPSFKFSKDGQILRSPVFEGEINGISFWAKGANAENSRIDVEGLAKGEWSNIYTFSPEDNNEKYVDISAGIPSETHQIRFKMTRSKGSIALDDIVIKYGDKGELLPGYDNLSTQNATKVKIENLPAGEKFYYLTVSSTDGNSTEESEIVYFELKGETESSVGITVEDSQQVEYYNLMGQKIERPEKGSLVIVRKNLKTEKVIF